MRIMDFFSKHKTISIVIIIVVIIALYFVFAPAKKETGLVEEVSPSVSSVVDTGFVALLLQLKSITLDETLFQSGLFQAFEDFTVPIPEQRVGRPNPFAPINTQEVDIPAGGTETVLDIPLPADDE